MEPTLKTTIDDEMINFSTDIDLNQLFHLNYNFDLLKNIMDQVLKNENALANRLNKMSENNNNTNKTIEKLIERIQNLEENKADKKDVNNMKDDLEEIKKHLKLHDDQIDDIYSKLKNIDNKFNNLNIPKEINNVVNFDSTDIDQNILKLKEDLEALKKQLKELEDNHKITVSRVDKNKELIDGILARLEDILRLQKEGDEKNKNELDLLKQFIENKIKEIEAQLELLMRTPLKSGKSIEGTDLKIISDILKRLNELEKNFKDFVDKIKIDEIIKEIELLKKDMLNKANSSDLEQLKNQLKSFENEIKKIWDELNNLNNKYDKHNDEIEYIKQRLDDLNLLIKKLENMLNNLPTNNGTISANIDFNDYVKLSVFNEFKNLSEENFKKIFDELENLKRLIDEIFELLKNKANLSDLNELRDFLLSKIDELAIACNKKFADKNETARNLHYLEQQIKKILSLLLNKDDKADNWLLAKKPLNGYFCASCEANLDLKDNTQYVPWNRLPLRNPNEKLYRIGNGFSKMLQMLNFDDYNINNNINASTANSPPRTGFNFYNKKENAKERYQSAHYRNININNNNYNNNNNNNNGSSDELSNSNNIASNSNNGLPKIKTNNNINNKDNNKLDNSLNGTNEEEENQPKIMKIYKKGKKN